MAKVKIPSNSTHCRNLIGGEWTNSTGSKKLDVVSPYDGSTIGTVPLSSKNDVDAAVAGAKAAFQIWREQPIKERCRPLFNLRALLLEQLDELANIASAESGKTVGEAAAGIHKGIEVIEYALSLQNIDAGGAVEVSRGVTCQLRREPLGVVAGVVPFNFPAMVPMWLFPIAITAGNTFVLKPSEKVPLTMTKMAELFEKAGYPKGVFSIVHGGVETVQALTDHNDVKAFAFVGSTPVARDLYSRAASAGKRALCLGGAKNAVIVLPDADPSVTIDGATKSFMGCAGQRCMAASLMIAVGDCDALINKIVDHAQSFKLGSDMGAVIDEAALGRLNSAIEKAESEGAKIILDGRKATPPKEFSDGYWLGPTIIDHATREMSCVRDELFGPILTIIRTATLNEAVALSNQSAFGNATSVFTTSGAAADFVARKTEAGMIGVNIGVPVPREPFSFGGTKASKFGHGDITGSQALDFWTDLKKITSKWEMQSDRNWMS